MRSFSFSSSSHSLCYCYLLCLSLVAATTPGDIINKTCQKCAADSATFDLTFCETSLAAVPVSRATNLQGLGIIAMELALENATSTVERINALLNSTADADVMARLEDCSVLYSGAGKTLVFAIGAFLSGDYRIANTWVGAAMEAATTCEERFAGGGDVSPLTWENRDLFQLSDIALCITRSLAAHFEAAPE